MKQGAPPAQCAAPGWLPFAASPSSSSSSASSKRGSSSSSWRSTFKKLSSLLHNTRAPQEINTSLAHLVQLVGARHGEQRVQRVQARHAVGAARASRHLILIIEKLAVLTVLCGPAEPFHTGNLLCKQSVISLEVLTHGQEAGAHHSAPGRG